MRHDPGSISIAFLDLLSGALAGVIILFIIVPKGQSAVRPTELVEQKVSIDSLFIVIDSLYLGQDTLTTLDIELLRESMSALRTRVDSVQEAAAIYRNEVVRSKARQVVLLDSLRRARTDLRRSKQQNKSSDPAAKASPPVPKPLPTRKTPQQRPQASTTPTADPSSTSPSTTSPSVAATPAQASSSPRDPMPEMLDPFMVDIKWNDEQDIDLLLLSRAGVVLCNDSRCNKKYAAHERSGKRDTAQYERMRLTSREPETYEVRVAVHSRFGGKGGDAVPVRGDYYIKQAPGEIAVKRSFALEVSPRQRGESGAPGARLGSITITDDGKVVFNTEQ